MKEIFLFIKSLFLKIAKGLKKNQQQLVSATQMAW